MIPRTTTRRHGKAIASVLALSLTCTACGTLLYPERHGQTGGRIDPAVAVLDGVGVLVFIIPGLVAFGVDFATGAIYLPGGRATARAEAEKLEVVRRDPKTLSIHEIEQIVSARIGEPVRVDAHTFMYGLASAAELGEEYAKLEAAGVTR